jgi:predicted DNA-binding protein
MKICYADVMAFTDNGLFSGSGAHPVNTDYLPPPSETITVPEALIAKYRARYESIIHAPLTPENIKTYADDALYEFGDLLEDAHREVGISVDDYSAETEKAIAAKLLGLNSPWDIRVSIRAVQEDINRLGQLVSNSEASPSKSYYVPPRPEELPVFAASDGSFEEAAITPRTATILFLLEKDFGVDLDNPEEFAMESGAIPDNAMRSEPYNKLEVKQLNRLILVCDQMGNRTFVFDTSQFDKLGLTTDQVAAMDKPELDGLLKQYPYTGSDLIYSKNFTDNMKELIDSPTKPSAPEDNGSRAGSVRPAQTSRAPDHLVPLQEKPEEYISLVDFSKSSGIHVVTLRNQYKSGKLGGGIYKFRDNSSHRGGAFSYALSPEQQEEAIRIKRERDESLAGLTSKPEGYGFVSDLVEGLGIERRMLDYWITSGKFGMVEKFRKLGFSRGAFALSPEQQKEAIKLNEANNERMADLTEKPEGYEFVSDFAKSLEISYGKLHEWAMSDMLGGKVERFINQHSPNGDAYALSPEQQSEAIRLNKEDKERLADLTEKPEGYEFIIDFVEKSGIPLGTLGSWVASGKLGGTKRFFSQSSVTGDAFALSPKQQDEAIRLRDEIEGLKTNLSEKPEGFVFLIDFAKSLEISYGKLSYWMKSGKLGGNEWKFLSQSSPTGVALALSPEQQIEAIRLKGKLNEHSERLIDMPEKPEGYVFLIDFIRSSKIDDSTIYNWLISGKLGGGAKKFRNSDSPIGSSYALSPEQQAEAIRLKLETDEKIASLPEKPEGYEFIGDFASTIGVNRNTLSSWLKSGKLGVAEKFRKLGFSEGASALSPEQQKAAITLKKEVEERMANLSEKPGGYEFVPDFAEKSDIKKETLRNWLISGLLGDEIQEFRNPNSPKGSTYAISPEQQKRAVIFENRTVNDNFSDEEIVQLAVQIRPDKPLTRQAMGKGPFPSAHVIAIRFGSVDNFQKLVRLKLAEGAAKTTANENNQ